MIPAASTGLRLRILRSPFVSVTDYAYDYTNILMLILIFLLAMLTVTLLATDTMLTSSTVGTLVSFRRLSMAATATRYVLQSCEVEGLSD